MTISGLDASAAFPEEDGLCIFNGIDGETGDYLLPPLPMRQLADLARREPRYHLPELRPREAPQSGPREKGPGADVLDPRNLGQTGWGVVFSDPVDPAVREALAPLLQHRQRQAAEKRKGRYHQLTYRAGESKAGFLARHGVPPGPANADRMPYYLLLVGDPEEIPFELQYQLDIQYAVGRIHFETPEEYERYARTVVEAETGRVRRSPAAVFFGPRNPGDRATALSCDHLAAPLAQGLADQLSGWSVRTVLGKDATRDRLSAVLEGDGTPALLFTAGHGLCYRPGHPYQLPWQGSLICQEWDGPGHPIRGAEHAFTAENVSADARIAGLIALHFSCFGAGTPRCDAFPEPLFGEREIAPKAFLSKLARRLLAHPEGGALAVVGHVDRAWSWSFSDLQGDHAFRPVFENTLKALTMGYPLGYAMEYFNLCYAELASDLDDELRRSPTNDRQIAQLWTNRNDARNYAVLGDPAVRLAVAFEEIR